MVDAQVRQSGGHAGPADGAEHLPFPREMSFLPLVSPTQPRPR